MAAQRKLSKIAQAYERCKIGRDALHAVGARCMEVTEDKAGIVWERYYLLKPDGDSNKVVNIVLFATPSWWDVFTPITEDQTNDGTVAAIKALAK